MEEKDEDSVNEQIQVVVELAKQRTSTSGIIMQRAKKINYLQSISQRKLSPVKPCNQYKTFVACLTPSRTSSPNTSQEIEDLNCDHSKEVKVFFPVIKTSNSCKDLVEVTIGSCYLSEELLKHLQQKVFKMGIEEVGTLQEKDLQALKQHLDDGQGLQSNCLQEDPKEASSFEVESQSIHQELQLLKGNMAKMSEIKAENSTLKKELKQVKRKFKELQEKSSLINEVLEDRNRLSKKVEELQDAEEQATSLRLKTARIEDLEKQLKLHKTNNLETNNELNEVRGKCFELETELEQHKSQADSLRTKIVCLDLEMDSLKTKCKEAEELQQEKERINGKIAEFLHMQCDLHNQIKMLEVVKAEREMYKTKYEKLVNLDGDQVRKLQVKHKSLLEEVEDLKQEIERLLLEKDEQQAKMQKVFSKLRKELEEKDIFIGILEDQLELFQSKLEESIEELHKENDSIKMENVQVKETNIQLNNELLLKTNTMKELECRIVAQDKTCLAAQNLQKEIVQLRADNATLQETVKTVDGTSKDLMKQLKCAVKKIAEELLRQYAQWDAMKKNLKTGSSGNEDWRNWDCKRRKLEEVKPLKDQECQNKIKELEFKLQEANSLNRNLQEKLNNVTALTPMEGKVIKETETSSKIKALELELKEANSLVKSLQAKLNNNYLREDPIKNELEALLNDKLQEELIEEEKQQVLEAAGDAEEVTRLRTMLEEAQNYSNKLKLDNEHLQNELNLFKDKLNEEEGGNFILENLEEIARLREELQISQENNLELDEIKNNFLELQKEYASKNTELEDIKSKTTEQEVQEKSNQVQESNVDSGNLEELARLRKKLQEMQDNKQHELEELNNKLQDLEKKYASKEEELEDSKRNNELLLEETKLLENEVKEIHESLNEKGVRRVSKNSEEIARLRKEWEETQDSKQNELEELKKNYLELEKKYAEKGDELEDLKKKNELLVGDKKVLEKRVEEVNSAISQQSKSKDEKDKDLEKQLLDLKRLKQDYQKQDEEAKKLRNQLEESQANLEQTRLNNTKLSKDLEEMKLKLDQKPTKPKESSSGEDNTIQIKKDLAEKNALLNKLKVEYNEAQEQLERTSKLTSENEELKKQIETLQNDFKNTKGLPQSTMPEERKEETHLKDELAKALEDLKKSKEQIARQEEECKNRIVNLEEGENKLKADLKKAKDDLEKVLEELSNPEKDINKSSFMELKVNYEKALSDLKKAEDEIKENKEAFLNNQKELITDQQKARLNVKAFEEEKENLIVSQPEEHSKENLGNVTDKQPMKSNEQEKEILTDKPQRKSIKIEYAIEEKEKFPGKQQNENSELKKEITKLQEEIVKLKKLLKQAEHQSIEKSKLNKKTSEESQTSKKSKCLEQEIIKLKRSESDRIKLLKELEAALTDKAMLKNEIKKLKEQLDNLQASGVDGDLQELRNKLQDMTRENEALRASLTSTKNQLKVQPPEKDQNELESLVKKLQVQMDLQKQQHEESLLKLTDQFSFDLKNIQGESAKVLPQNDDFEELICKCGSGLKELLLRAVKEGFNSLELEELQMLHAQITTAANKLKVSKTPSSVLKNTKSKLLELQSSIEEKKEQTSRLNELLKMEQVTSGIIFSGETPRQNVRRSQDGQHLEGEVARKMRAPSKKSSKKYK